MATTKIDIANQALALVGMTSITALTDNTDQARRCDEHIDAAILEVLQAGVWTRASKRGASGIEAWVTATDYSVDDLVTNGGNTYRCLVAHTSGTFATDLAALKWVLTSTVSISAGTTPPYGWSYAFTLPTDFVRLVSYNEIDECNIKPEMFRIEGGSILTNDTAIYLTYVYDIATGVAGGTTLAVTAPDLIELMALKLAIKLAWPFQQDNTQKRELQQEYFTKLSLAKSLDSRQTRRGLRTRRASSRWLADRYNGTKGQ